MIINEPALEMARWNRFEWNGGIIPEYWKSTYQDEFEHRVGVRFNERQDGVFTVYIFTSRSMLPLLKIETMETLELLWEILAGQRR